MRNKLTFVILCLLQLVPAVLAAEAQPKRARVAKPVAAPEGVQKLTATHPDVPIHLVALDSCLNDRGYIVPGMGDAGDRQFSGD